MRKMMSGWQLFGSHLGQYQEVVDRVIIEMDRRNVVGHLWAHDHTLWKPDPAEITNRLGWLHIIEAMQDSLPRIYSFVERARADGYTRVVLLGMGGSSLAPEVFRKTFGVENGYLDLAVLDSTDPGAILEIAEGLDFSRTLFTVSTKSGTTIETISLMKYFYNRVAQEVGESQTGEHFIAITDPGTRLEETARRCQFREIFLNDPNIGGRFAALSYVGFLQLSLGSTWMQF
jgi:glucose-6-phosphate isomerase